jgi:hypothetical protein
LKKSALADPEKCLFKINQGSSELNTIFKHINSLSFEERPNYQLIKLELSKIFRAEMAKLQLKPQTSLTASNSQQKLVAPVLGKKRGNGESNEPSIISTKTQSSEGSMKKMMPPEPKRQKTNHHVSICDSQNRLS